MCIPMLNKLQLQYDLRSYCNNYSLLRELQVCMLAYTDNDLGVACRSIHTALSITNDQCRLRAHNFSSECLAPSSHSLSRLSNKKLVRH